MLSDVGPPIELGRPECASAHFPAYRANDISFFEASSEAGFIEAPTKNRFADRLELAEGELVRGAAFAQGSLPKFRFDAAARRSPIRGRSSAGLRR